MTIARDPAGGAAREVARTAPSRPQHGPAASRPSGRAGHLLALQRLAGNAAVQRLVGPLTPGQVARAVSFYRLDPKRYTAAIVQQIQTALGTDPTGTMAEVDVQAVAVKQGALNAEVGPKLKVDGMAGPRTLPQMFHFGLAEEGQLTAYTDAAKAEFAKGGDEEAETRALYQGVLGGQLAPTGMPLPKLEVEDDLGFRGAFNKEGWLVRMDRSQFSPGPHHDLKETTSTLYHEVRHGQQHFTVARMFAGEGLDEAQITARTGIAAPEVVKAAHDRPLATDDVQATIAKGWFDSLDTARGRAAIGANNAEITAASAAVTAAQKAVDANPSPANQARLAQAKARRQAAIDAHDDLPHEFDAERVESRVEQRFDAPAPGPAAPPGP